MTDYVVCPSCGAARTTAVCETCGDRPLTPTSAAGLPAGARHTGFGQRFLIASVPAALLALFVDSTLYGYVLYLGVYLTYLAWLETTRPVQARSG